MQIRGANRIPVIDARSSRPSPAAPAGSGRCVRNIPLAMGKIPRSVYKWFQNPIAGDREGAPRLARRAVFRDSAFRHEHQVGLFALRQAQGEW